MAEGAVSLGDAEWTLVELDGRPLEIDEDEHPPSLVLDLEESHVIGTGGCNRLTGSFALSEAELTFGPLATTRMACPEPVMRRERAFLDALAQVTSYELEGRVLRLLAGDDAVATLTR